VKIWDSVSGELKQTLEGPEDIEFAHWHSKGNAVVAGSKDGTVWLWLAHEGTCLQVLAGHDGGVSSGMFSKDGKSILTGGDDGTIRVWSPKTGACKYVFSGHEGHEATVTSMDCSDDGETIITGTVQSMHMHSAVQCSPYLTHQMTKPLLITC
jgi:ribosome assembly protein SQT1